MTSHHYILIGFAVGAVAGYVFAAQLAGALGSFAPTFLAPSTRLAS